MSTNDDGTVVLKTTGKVASQGSGSGTGQVKPPQAKSSKSSVGPVRQAGRGAAGKSARAH